MSENKKYTKNSPGDSVSASPGDIDTGFIPLSNMSPSAQMSFKYLHPELLSNQPIELKDKKNELLPIITTPQLMQYEEPKHKWVVDNIIQANSINFITGKRRMLKSWAALVLGYAVSSGIDYLGQFPTTKSAVLYLDRENGYSILKERAAMVQKGLGLEQGEMDFLSMSDIKLDSFECLRQLEANISGKNYSLIIVDTYRRFIDIDENDAQETSKFLTNKIKPFCLKNNCAFLFLHHERKGSEKGEPDDMDRIRGSSDLANIAEGVVQIERKGNNLVFKQSKLRGKVEMAPFYCSINTDEKTSFHLSFEGLLETLDERQGLFIIKRIIREEKLQEFTYSHLWREYAKGEGLKETSYKRALRALIELGALSKDEGKRGAYHVKDNLGAWGATP